MPRRQGRRPLVSMSGTERLLKIRLHILKGRLDAGGDGECAMEQDLWSNLTEDILTRVLLFLPAAKLFQFQAVCRKWRALLSSTDFRKKVMALSLPQFDLPVVACVTPGRSIPATPSDGGCKVADINLSFVPHSFWKSEAYSVVAADDGLVCISDGSQSPEAVERHGVQLDASLCVINPLTKTCKVLSELHLPDLPWLDSSVVTVRFLAGMVTVFVCSFGLFNDVWQWAIASYDLKASKWSIAHGPVRPDSLRNSQGLAHEGHYLLYNGEVYTYGNHTFHVHSINAGGIAMVGEIGTPRTLHDINLAYQDPNVYLAEHHGNIYFLAKVKRFYGTSADCYGIWKLIRSAMAWEFVSVLDRPEIDGMTRFKHQHLNVEHFLGAAGVGDFLCLELWLCKGPVDSNPITVGFNIKTGAWDLIHDNKYLKGAKVFQPRPDILIL